MDKMKLAADPAANHRKLQYFATELQGMVIFPTSSGEKRSLPFCAS